MDIFYNVTRQCRVDEDNCRLAGNPVLYFGACPEWTVHLYTGELGETPVPLDASDIPAFRAAVDVDWTSSTTPMCRTVSGIDVSQAEDGIITVPLDANTVRFGQVLDGSRSKDAYFELRGLDTNGDVALLILFPVTCHNVIDPDGGEPPEDTPSGYATEAYVDAVVSREIYVEFSADGTNWHTTLTTGDVYERIKHGSTGEWSDAFAIPYGPQGPQGPQGLPGELSGSAVDVTTVDAWTMSVWAKTIPDTDAAVVTLSNGNYGVGGGEIWLLDKADGTVMVVNGAASDNIITETTGVSVGWHHCAIVWTGSVFRLYIDGTQQGSDASTVYSASGAYLYVNSLQRATGAVHGQGKYAALRLYDRALTALEITALAGEFTPSA